MKWKRVLVIGGAGLMLLGVAYWRTSYRPGTPPPLKAISAVDPVDVVKAARELRGVLYDPLQGRGGNLGGRLGFIVCIDVPVIAYRQSGLSLEETLAADFKVHPDAYDTKSGNTPDNPFFHRRARNLYAYCVANGRLAPMTDRPRVADVVFYKKAKHSYVSHIALVTRVDADGRYWLMEAAPETVVTREQRSEAIVARGWQPQGIGRILPLRAADRDSGSPTIGDPASGD